MIRAIVHGAGGHMGSILADLAEKADDFELVAKVDKYAAGGDILPSLYDFTGEADVVIDFSHHTSAPELIAWALAHKTAVIVATTGHDDAEKAQICAAGAEIPVFYAANMSIGIALLCELAKKTAAVFPDADIEIVEMHHNRKLDAPSGTALKIADAVRESRPGAPVVCGRSGMAKREKGEIGIASLRMGNLPGTHEVIVTTNNQAITLKHEVYDRALFADGALAAARFLVGKPAGLYDVKDIIG